VHIEEEELNSHKNVEHAEEDGVLWRRLFLSEEDRLRLFPAESYAGPTPTLSHFETYKLVLNRASVFNCMPKKAFWRALSVMP
jgi:hypothetical protein